MSESRLSASTPEDLSSVEIIDDLRAENEQLQATLRGLDASEARERLKYCTCMDEAERICNGLLIQLAAQAAELATLRKEIVWNSVVNVPCPHCGKCVTVNTHDELPFLKKRTQEFEDNADRLTVENATLREGLAAVVDAFKHYKAVKVIGWSVFIKETGRNGLSPHAELFTALAELAAGWIPPSTKGEG